MNTKSHHHLPGFVTPALLTVLAGLVNPGHVATGEEPTRAVTIYSSAQPGAIDPALYRPTRGTSYNAYAQPIPGYAVVREDRQVQLAQGQGEVRISDVAALIDPTTVSFRSLTDPVGTRVVDQNFQFDLVSTEKLLQRYVGEPVSIIVPRGDSAGFVDGTLLSSGFSGVVVQDPRSGALTTVTSMLGASLPALPSGFVSKPTLVWNTTSTTGGSQTARISYQTEGITWWADYNVIYSEGSNANAGELDVGAWVSILNQSGATYDNTRLKLVAGDVQRAPKPDQYQRSLGMSARAEASAAPPAFEEKSFFEYHLYTLSQPTTIPDNSTKQLELFPTAQGVPCEKVLVYTGQDWSNWWGVGSDPMTNQDYGIPVNREVDVYLRFHNRDQHGLGMPLPAGRIRVSKLDDADGALEFIGEDIIKHTPRNEQVLIRLGSAFDVVGERTQVAFSSDIDRRRIDETIEVQVRNRKREAVKVIIQERMFRWTNWQFVGQVPDHKKLDASTVQFPVTIEPDASTTIRYTVRYTW